jgi:hypothetical protein
MAEYEVNPAAAAYAREPIDKRQYVLNGDWGAVQPNAERQNAFLERRIDCCCWPASREHPPQTPPAWHR